MNSYTVFVPFTHGDADMDELVLVEVASEDLNMFIAQLKKSASLHMTPIDEDLPELVRNYLAKHDAENCICDDESLGEDCTDSWLWPPDCFGFEYTGAYAKILNQNIMYVKTEHLMGK